MASLFWQVSSRAVNLLYHPAPVPANVLRRFQWRLCSKKISHTSAISPDYMKIVFGIVEEGKLRQCNMDIPAA